MTANELAEKLTDCLGKKERWDIRVKASKMLIDQATKIDKLEKNIIKDEPINITIEFK
jgi:hypothetical protein